MTDQNALTVPKNVSDQKVELTLSDLANLAQKPAAQAETPVVSKDDFIRLAELKIDKLFKPKIQKAANRVALLEAKIAEKFPRKTWDDACLEHVKKYAQPFIEKVEKIFALITSANEQINSMSDEFEVPVKSGLLSVPEPEISVHSSGREYIVYTVQFGNFGISKKREIKTNTDMKKFDDDKMAMSKKLKKAREDQEILEKSYTKAKGEITNEVELGLLESSISKSEVDQQTALDINERLEKSIKTLYLSDSNES